MEYPTQVLFILNAEGDFSNTELLPYVNPNRYEFLCSRLSECQPPPIVREDGKRLHVDWEGLADAMERMLELGREKGSVSGRILEFYAAGQAPLPLFTLFGMKWAAWGPQLTFLNRRQTNKWDVLPLAEQVEAAQGPIFDVIAGLSESSISDGTGYVAVFVSTNGKPAPKEAIRSALRSDGKEVTAVIEVRTSDSRYLDRTNFAATAEQLARLVSQIPGAYPHTAGLAVFVFGPGSLAFLVGRAINPTMFTEVLIGNYEAQTYELVLRWPRVGSRLLPISMESHDILERVKVLDEMKKGIADVQATIQEQDLPDFMDCNSRNEFIANIQKVQLPNAPEGESFELHVLRGRMVLGHGLLDALKAQDQQSIRRIAALLFLHEIYHFHQHLHTTNFRNIGRAGVAIEEIDFWADSVAVCALTLRDMRRAVDVSGGVSDNYLAANVAGILSGIEAFDRFEQGERIHRLAERRLRRYLIWHLQLARAKANPRTELSAREMLAHRLIVELAPLVGPPDSRYEKIVRSHLPTTELHVVLDKKLFRFSPNTYINPEKIIECVRSFDRKGLEESMDHVVMEHHQDFAPRKTSSI